MKFKIKYVSKEILKDYWGMNKKAAESLNFPFPYSKNTILVRDDLSAKDKKITFKHEVEEFKKMSRGSKYWGAHLYALKNEKK